MVSERVNEPKSPKLSKQYMKAIAEAVDEALEMLFGKTIKEVVSAYTLQKYGFKVETCHENHEAFTKALMEVFGENPAMIIENLVVKKLRSNLNIKDIDENYSLIEFIEKLKRRAE